MTHCELEDRSLDPLPGGALAALVTIVLAEGAPAVRWIAFGTATGCGFIAVGLIVTLALGWDNPSESKGSLQR